MAEKFPRGRLPSELESHPSLTAADCCCHYLTEAPVMTTAASAAARGGVGGGARSYDRWDAMVASYVDDATGEVNRSAPLPRAAGRSRTHTSARARR